MIKNIVYNKAVSTKTSFKLQNFRSVTDNRLKYLQLKRNRKNYTLSIRFLKV